MLIPLGFPGSAHDSSVFTRSSLCQKLSSENCGGLLDPVYHHIIGDSAFKLSEWLLTPFSRKENLSRSEKRFNSKLNGTRVIVEQAYGDLKNRFRRLNDVCTCLNQTLCMLCLSLSFTTHVFKTGTF